MLVSAYLEKERKKERKKEEGYRIPPQLELAYLSKISRAASYSTATACVLSQETFPAAEGEKKHMSSIRRTVSFSVSRPAQMKPMHISHYHPHKVPPTNMRTHIVDGAEHGRTPRSPCFLASIPYALVYLLLFDLVVLSHMVVLLSCTFERRSTSSQVQKPRRHQRRTQTYS